MKLSKRSWLAGAALSIFMVVGAIGCAGPNGGNRLFTSNRAPTESPQYVGGGVPLPSQQGVHPASVAMPASGNYGAAAMQDIRARRSGYLNRSGGACLT